MQLAKVCASHSRLYFRLNVKNPMVNNQQFINLISSYLLAVNVSKSRQIINVSNHSFID